MKSCALGLAVDGFMLPRRQENFRWRQKLENQINLSSTCQLNEDTFTHTEENIIAAAPSFTIIDENDDDVNIED